MCWLFSQQSFSGIPSHPRFTLHIFFTFGLKGKKQLRANTPKESCFGMWMHWPWLVLFSWVLRFPVAEGRNLITAFFFCLWNRFILTFWWRTRYVWRELSGLTQKQNNFSLPWLLHLSSDDGYLALLLTWNHFSQLVCQHLSITPEKWVRMGLACWLMSSRIIDGICDPDVACHFKSLLFYFWFSLVAKSQKTHKPLPYFW